MKIHFVQLKSKYKNKMFIYRIVKFFPVNLRNDFTENVVLDCLVSADFSVNISSFHLFTSSNYFILNYSELIRREFLKQMLPYNHNLNVLIIRTVIGSQVVMMSDGCQSVKINKMSFLQ